MTILDGKIVSDEEIVAGKHVFVGTYRDPSFEIYFNTLKSGSKGNFDLVMCSCGHSLWTIEETHEHWLMGHMDVMVYKTVGE